MYFLVNRLLSVGAIEGFADDYAFVVGGLLDLFESSQDQRWLELACKLQDKQDELFWDEDSGGYFSSTSNDPSILLHMKEGMYVHVRSFTKQDTATPMGHNYTHAFTYMYR